MLPKEKGVKRVKHSSRAPFMLYNFMNYSLRLLPFYFYLC
jgi:hypothetical protein